MSITKPTFDPKTTLEQLSDVKNWDYEGALNQEYKFVAPPSFGRRLLCATLGCCRNPYSDEFRSAQEKTSDTTNNIKEMIITIIIANHEKQEELTKIKETCRNVVENFNTYTHAWPKLRDHKLDFSKIVHSAQHKLTESQKKQTPAIPMLPPSIEEEQKIKPKKEFNAEKDYTPDTSGRQLRPRKNINYSESQ